MIVTVVSTCTDGYNKKTKPHNKEIKLQIQGGLCMRFD